VNVTSMDTETWTQDAEVGKPDKTTGKKLLNKKEVAGGKTTKQNSGLVSQ